MNVPAKYVFAIPDNLSELDAAAVAMNYIVAYILLFELGNLSTGKKVLVHSAGGGVVSLHIIPTIYNMKILFIILFF